MHTFGENSTAVPAFLAKLWRLVEDEDTNNLIYWSAVSRSFSISAFEPVLRARETRQEEREIMFCVEDS